ncbi:MAG: hypothetical protein PHS73_05335 [Candidatus Peribacteraceae bacterium]|nr:hypothetical protein [Candidatus Peribacteraceae bacterium]
MKRSVFLLACGALLLFGCAFSAADTQEAEGVSGGKSGIISTGQLGQPPAMPPRPSGMLGIFSGVFLSQGMFYPTQTGLEGIDALLTILQGQEQPVTDETFQLLEQLGTALSVDVIDLLNRSHDRADALTQYTEALGTVNTNSKRTLAELTVAGENLAKEKKDQRNVVRAIEKDISAAVKAKDFGTAGARQGELNTEQATLSAIELKEQQNNDTLRTFKDMTARADARLQAIETNREILIAGLQITDPKGLKDLGVLTEGQRSSRIIQ